MLRFMDVIGTVFKPVLKPAAILIIVVAVCFETKSNPLVPVTQNLRAPAFPLITIDPYTNAWSCSDRLYDDVIRHWTGRRHGLIGAIRVDGQVYRFLGKENVQAEEVFRQTAIQKSVSLSATQTHYAFACGPVDLKLTFISPLLPDNLDVLSRPVNYIAYEAKSNDGQNHEVQVYFEATPEWAVDHPGQEVSIEKAQTGNLTYFKAGTTSQAVLSQSGDDRRIDWGYFYLCGKTSPDRSYAMGNADDVKQGFLSKGKLNDAHPKKQTAFVDKNMPVMACAAQLGAVGKKPVSGNIMIGYDDLYAIQYFGENRMAWWKKDGLITMEDVLKSASSEYIRLRRACAKFDDRLWQDAIAAGGENYADLCVLAFRQAISAHKLLKDKGGNTLFFSKENFSNGCIGTVDVTYPSAPLFLVYNPELLKGMLNPIFYYSESGKWNKPFAAHDLGKYPLANGQTYGHDMPVEECGNMLILTAAIAHVERNAGYAQKHWDVLTLWANYLMEHGLNPENQLCTDDFAGHSAHNTNLSIKAIMGIAGYGKLAAMLGKTDVSEKYAAKARQMAAQWVEMGNDGDHFRLTFDQPGTWSQKYNLVWDKILQLRIFPEDVAKKEISYYLTRQHKYGLPLDSRKSYTKSDWIVWTATMADDTETFQKFIGPLHRFMNETTDRVPMTDWYETTEAKKIGFQARSVVGGYFIKMLQISGIK